VTGNFIALSISHRRAPVEVREALQLSEEETRRLLAQFPQFETLVLSTCNRTEIYAYTEEEKPSLEQLLESLFELKHVAEEQRAGLRNFFETLEWEETIRHLFAVITGIDSQIVGDQQIFAQVKEAFRLSEAEEASGAFLRKLSQVAFRVAKRVITETTLNEGAATISYAAVEFARKIYDDFEERHILIIGAGESAELATKHFLDRRARRITIANRSVERAREMISRVRANDSNAELDILPIEELPVVLSSVDILVSATSATDYVLTRSTVEEALKRKSSSSPMVMIDIAVPRDLEPSIGTLPNVFLKDIDDLRSIVDRNTERRRHEIPKAEAIIEEERSQFLAALSRLQAGPTIKALRDKFEAVRKEELERNKGKLDEKSFAMLDEMTRRMMNRLLHTPAVELKESSETADILARLELVRTLFGLDP
jgi:glutamyl-tRNA reductase